MRLYKFIPKSDVRGISIKTRPLSIYFRSRPTPMLYFEGFLVAAHGRASFLISNIGCLGDVFVLISNIMLFWATFLSLFQTSCCFVDPPRSGARTCVVFDFKHRLSW